MSNANTFSDARLLLRNRILACCLYFQTIWSNEEVTANRAKSVILVTPTVNRVMQDLGPYSTVITIRYERNTFSYHFDL